MSYWREGEIMPSGFPYRQFPQRYCGSNSDRQSVGDPGHCEDCVSVGHVVAHPDLGCGDVGCYASHASCVRCGNDATQVDEVSGEVFCAEHAGPLAWDDCKVNAYTIAVRLAGYYDVPVSTLARDKDAA